MSSVFPSSCLQCLFLVGPTKSWFLLETWAPRWWWLFKRDVFPSGFSAFSTPFYPKKSL